MITELTKPPDILIEFNEDMEKVEYWKEKHFKRMSTDLVERVDKAGKFDTLDCEPLRYHSKNNNEWLVWMTAKYRGMGIMPRIHTQYVCYRLLNQYMTVCAHSKMVDSDGGDGEGVSCYARRVRNAQGC